MELNVLLFASYAEAVGSPSVRITVGDGATASDVVAAVQQLVPAAALPSALVAINHEYAPHGRRIEPGDEVAIIPPVAGG